MFLEAVKLGATTAGGLLNATPFQASLAMHRSRSVGVRSPVPFAMVAFNGAVWSIYGVVLRSWFPVVAANSIGVVSGLFALAVFRVYADLKSAAAAARLLSAFCVGVLLALGLTQSLILEPVAYPNTQNALGLFCDGVSVGMFASPLVTVREVFRSRSTASISPVVTAASTVSSSLWFIYGAAINDLYVWLPNVLGIALSLFQVGLFVRFRNHHTNGHHHHHYSKSPTPAV
ncbi:hypothetical protein CTAYLR_006756 [Chrysophaeum taylorii]|uniref:Sugar transporter SWEET1 n=1 Tax=Chrysophaeum taylorii TaxID=2483200 RepID=A0AAD7XKK1_9STRA|nr:hypothetical protein CTAYLR_006756 [Chrysophaeum taylorii]